MQKAVSRKERNGVRKEKKRGREENEKEAPERTVNMIKG